MSTTTPIFGPDFVKDIIPWMFQVVADATKQAYRMMWNWGMSALKEHMIAIILILFGLLVFSYLRALITRRWGLFGSVLYNYLYFGTLFIIGLIFGPETFANDYFEIFLAILYVVCFILVGKILIETGVKRR